MKKLILPGRRPRGRPKRRFMDVVKEDMKLAGEWKERMQRIGIDGGRWLAVATPEGNNWEEKIIFVLASKFICREKCICLNFMALVIFIYSEDSQESRADMQQRVTGWELNLQPLQEKCSLQRWAACLNHWATQQTMRNLIFEVIIQPQLGLGWDAV